MSILLKEINTEYQSFVNLWVEKFVMAKENLKIKNIKSMFAQSKSHSHCHEHILLSGAFSLMAKTPGLRFQLAPVN